MISQLYICIHNVSFIDIMQLLTNWQVSQMFYVANNTQKLFKFIVDSSLQAFLKKL